MSILVTGANGFIGTRLCAYLLGRGEIARAVVRRSEADVPFGVEKVVLGTIGSKTQWGNVLEGVKVVVHLAARVHIEREAIADSMAAFRLENVDATLNLARQAAESGVRRFLFLSSVKVNGEETPLGRPFTEGDQPAPQDTYAVSKWEAEQGLRKLAAETGMEVVIIRPPLVYGVGVKANFYTMMRWLHRGIPLPLGAIRNQRSFVALDNLVDLIMLSLRHPAAADQTFLVSDGEDLSTPELLQRTAVALGIPVLLVPMPVWMLKVGAVLSGKQATVQRLSGSLQIDITKARTLMNWTPPQSVDEALRKAACDFLTGCGRG